MSENNKIVINRVDNINNIFVYENGEIVEQYQEEIDNKRLEGNIYLGKVENVIKGMQSAFVNIGTGKNALIHIRDIIPKESKITGNTLLNENEYNINDIIKQGEQILVQIKKDSSKSKGARVTKDIKVIGKYVIVMPYSNYITVSRKIEDSKEKKRLKKIIEENLKDVQYGIIIRTSSLRKDEKDIIEDLEDTLTLWNEIKNESKKLKAPIELYSNNGIVGKLITDYKPLGLEIVTNSEDEKDYICSIDDNVDVKIDFNLNSEIEDKKKIWLKCGGFITIDKTEALVAIDVNSGKCLGKKHLEETVYKVNKEAAVEIARQLRLRDLGGIIIVDFIDMKEENSRKEIINIMKEAFKRDRSNVQIIEFTKLGLLEITRKNIHRK